MSNCIVQGKTRNACDCRSWSLFNNKAGFVVEHTTQRFANSIRIIHWLVLMIHYYFSPLIFDSLQVLFLRLSMLQKKAVEICFIFIVCLEICELLITGPLFFSRFQFIVLEIARFGQQLQIYLAFGFLFRKITIVSRQIKIFSFGK